MTLIIATGNSRQRTICVVREPLDVLAIECISVFRGLYHVPHGIIDPMNRGQPGRSAYPPTVGAVHGQQRGRGYPRPPPWG